MIDCRNFLRVATLLTVLGLPLGINSQALACGAPTKNKMPASRKSSHFLNQRVSTAKANSLRESEGNWSSGIEISEVLSETNKEIDTNNSKTERPEPGHSMTELKALHSAVLKKRQEVNARFSGFKDQ